MNALKRLAVAAALAWVAACSDKPEAAAPTPAGQVAEAPAPAPAAAPPAASPEVPVPADFAAQAAAEITPDNYKEALDRLAAEIEAE